MYIYVCALLCTWTCVSSHIESDCVSLFAFSSFKPLLSVFPLIILSSSHILWTSCRFFCTLYFPSSSLSLARYPFIHSLTLQSSLSSLSLILYFFHLCSLRGLISIRVTANSWSVSSTPSIQPSSFLSTFFYLCLSLSLSVGRLFVSVYCTAIQVVNLWIVCDEKEIGGTKYIIYWQ